MTTFDNYLLAAAFNTSPTAHLYLFPKGREALVFLGKPFQGRGAFSAAAAEV